MEPVIIVSSIVRSHDDPTKVVESVRSIFPEWDPDNTLENSDFKFKVKMNKNIESLNISNTVSVVCHHVFQSIK